MKYKDLRERQQLEFDHFPIQFAFSKEQFDEGMRNLGLDPSDTDKVVGISGGGFIRESDKLSFIDMCNRHSNELENCMLDPSFCEDAFYYEMWNHEYAINDQGDYDVLSCFGNIEYHGDDYLNELSLYFDELEFTTEQKNAYLYTRRKYLKDSADSF